MRRKKRETSAGELENIYTFYLEGDSRDRGCFFSFLKSTRDNNMMSGKNKAKIVGPDSHALYTL